MRHALDRRRITEGQDGPFRATACLCVVESREALIRRGLGSTADVGSLLSGTENKYFSWRRVLFPFQTSRDLKPLDFFDGRPNYEEK